MKNYLLLFMSTLLLLFVLPKNGSYAQRVLGMEQRSVKTSCATKRPVKPTCARKCLKHQTHSEQMPGANFASDCSQQVFAVISPQASYTMWHPLQLREIGTPASLTYLSPELKIDPEPPKLA
ncbi:hypothetical protein [Pontibacter oryzae]|nr:hypothetical protein [Pontibacter oryzae]